MVVLHGIDLEGSLCMAADRVTPQAINFMATHARGLVCLALDEVCFERLGIPLMVPEAENPSPLRSSFGVSIEARRGVTTGISAFDRAHTIQTAVSDQVGPDDLSRPGHVFPLRTHPRGVLAHSGCSEASVDLARLAGHKPAAVVCQVMNDDGSAARTSDLRRFATEHGLRELSVTDLLCYRLASEPIVRRTREGHISSRYGDFRSVAFTSTINASEIVVLTRGQIRLELETSVQVHSECVAGDIFASHDCACGQMLRDSLCRLADARAGVLIYLRDIDAREASERSCAALQGGTLVEPSLVHTANILRELGARRISLASERIEDELQLAAYGFEVSRKTPRSRRSAVSRNRFAGRVRSSPL